MVQLSCATFYSLKTANKHVQEVYIMMKTWKILKSGKGIVAYVNVNEKDNRDTSYYALRLARRYFNDNSISGTQRLAEGEEKNGNIPTLELYYPEHFTVDGIEYILTSLHCAVWNNEAYGFCSRADGTEGNYIVTFNNKEDLQPLEVALPM